MMCARCMIYRYLTCTLSTTTWVKSDQSQPDSTEKEQTKSKDPRLSLQSRCRLTSLTFVTKNGLRTEKSVHFSFRELRTSVTPYASVETFLFVFFLCFYVARNSRTLFLCSCLPSTYCTYRYLTCTCKREHMQNEWLMIADADADC